MLTNEVQLVSTDIVPKDLCVQTLTNLVDLDVDTSYTVTGFKREYAIVGDAYFASVTEGATPPWMVDLINDIIDNSLTALLGDIDFLKNSILASLRELDVAKNRYEELINIDVTIDSIIASRLATLNANLSNANAQIIELNIAKVTAAQAVAIAINQISAELTSPTSTLYGAITNIQVAVTSLNSEVDAKYTNLYDLNENMGYVLTAEINRVEASIEGVAEAVVESMDIAAATDLFAVAERTEKLSATLSNGPMKWVGKFSPTIPAAGSTTTVTVQVPAGSYRDRAGSVGAYNSGSGSYTSPTPAPAKVTVSVNASTGSVTFNFSTAVVLANLDALKKANTGITNILPTGNPAIWTATVPSIAAPVNGSVHLEVVVPSGAFKTTTGALVLGASGFGTITAPLAPPSVAVEVDGQTGTITARFSESPCNASGTPLTDAQVAAIVIVTGTTKGALGRQGNTYKWLVGGSPSTITATVAVGSYYGRTGIAGGGDTYSTAAAQPLTPDVLITVSATGAGVLKFATTPSISNVNLFTVLGGDVSNIAVSGSTVTFNVTPKKLTGSGVTVTVPEGYYSIGGVAGKSGQLYTFVDPLPPEVFVDVNVAGGEVVFSFNKPMQSFNAAAVMAANPFITAIIASQRISPTGPFASAERQVKVYADELEATADSFQTVTATLNGKIASVEVNMGAFVTSLGTLGSRYGVKLSTGGVSPGGVATSLVGGFELLNNGTVVSAGFDVDEFWIGRPGVTGKKPFRIVSGVVYIDSAVIQNASIDFAKITDSIQSDTWAAGVDPNRWRIGKNGVAEFQNIKARGDIEAQSLKAGTAMVDTLHVNGFAITAPSYAASTYNAEITAPGVVLDQSPMSLTMPTMSSGAVFVAVVIAGGAEGGDSTLLVELLKNGTLLASNGFTLQGGSTQSSTMTAYDPSPSGTNVYSLRISSFVRDIMYWSSSLLCIGAKR